MKRAASVNLSHAEKFFDQCERIGIARPTTITRAREALAIAEAHVGDPDVPDTLSMTDEEIRAFVEGRSLRRHTTISSGTGLEAGLTAFREQVSRDVAATIRVQLEDIVEQLRPRFEELSAPLVAAVRDHNFTLRMTADDIINMDNDAATAAWRDARRAWEAMAPIVAVRKRMNEVFNLRPDDGDLPANRHMSRTPNISVLFAAGNNWSLDDQFLAGTSNSLDWFELARGGIRLNSPIEVDEKLATRASAQARASAQQARAEAESASAAQQQLLAELGRGLSAGSSAR